MFELHNKLKSFWILNTPLIIFNFILLVTMIISILYKDFIFLHFSISGNNSAEVITVASIFAGFSYNGLNNITSYRNTPEFKKINSDGYLNRYYNSIYVAIFWSVCSILIGLFCYFSNFLDCNSIFYILEIVFLVYGILMFVFQTIQFKSLLNWIENKKY